MKAPGKRHGARRSGCCAVDPVQFPQTLHERLKAHLRVRIVGTCAGERSDAPQALGLLRARRAAT